MVAVLYCIVVQIILIINAVISIIICFSNKGVGWKLRISGESMIRLYYNAHPHIQVTFFSVGCLIWLRNVQ